jgi:DNA-binding NarL/FixJ family response regulator
MPPSRRSRPRRPTRLRASRFAVRGEDFIVLSFPQPATALPTSLSPAEREVACALLRGRTNAEIAAERGTSLRTVANQVASILLKAGVRSRSELLAIVGSSSS